MTWCCVQIGAREHYAIPRAVAQRGELQCLLTDAWVRPGSPLGFLHRHLRERFHAELAVAPVRAWSAGLLAFELAARARKLSGWRLILARNAWFQARIARHLAAMPAEMDLREMGTGTEFGLVSPSVPHADSEPAPISRPILFAYSYAALGPFRVAKERGWRTVLGQIDPGPPEERIVAELRGRYPQFAGAWQPAPAEYWAAWREECSLADVVMVNSEWSREALLAEGVPAEKIAVVPLAYERPAESGERRAESGERRAGSGERRAGSQDSPGPPPPGESGRSRYPAVFSKQRPLRVLFLGQANIRKGIHDLIDAADSIKGEPVVFDVAGPHGPLPQSLPGNLTFHGPVARGAVSRWYEQNDVFVLPTHSDGFALTQLEAMAHGLPVIATPRCGSVVEPGRSGWIVEPGNPDQLAEVIREAISDPTMLAELSAAAVRRVEDFSIERLSGCLLRLERGLANAAGQD
jgi:glycosyltransferase involved in cell wall biosynthesis